MGYNKIKKIKDKVSMSDLLNFLGFKVPNNSKYIKCPFHEDKTPSMIVHENRVHCFSCGRTMDIIDFTAQYFSISIIEAIDRLDKIFNCGVNEFESMEEIVKIREQMFIKEEEKKERQKIQEFSDKCLRQILEEMQECRKKIFEFDKLIEETEVIYRDYGSDFDKKVSQAVKAKFRLAKLEWFYDVIMETSPSEDCEYSYKYGVDKLEILKKIYDGEIKI